MTSFYIVVTQSELNLLGESQDCVFSGCHLNLESALRFAKSYLGIDCNPAPKQTVHAKLGDREIRHNYGCWYGKKENALLSVKIVRVETPMFVQLDSVWVVGTFNYFETTPRIMNNLNIYAVFPDFNLAKAFVSQMSVEYMGKTMKPNVHGDTDFENIPAKEAPEFFFGIRQMFPQLPE